MKAGIVPVCVAHDKNPKNICFTYSEGEWLIE